MSVWSQVVGQSAAIEQLARAAAAARGTGTGMTHAWLFTGPPGSGRSTAARAFAAALMCESDSVGCGTCQGCRTVLAGSHADLTWLRTESVVISRQQALELLPVAQRRPSIAPWRVVAIEDADRLNESSGNALLKAIEEPTSRTIWLLCAPSSDDVLVTIRSRCRAVRLRTPPAHEVAQLLSSRDGVPLQVAQFAAQAAQSHIGLARRLAIDPQARARRLEVLRLPLQIATVAAAVVAAGRLLESAKAEAESLSTAKDEQDRAELLRALGADPSARTQPPHVRAQLKTMTEQQKRRATRAVRDMLDRTLVDLMSLYRDVLRFGADPLAELINGELAADVARLSAEISAEGALIRLAAIRQARLRISANVAPLMALEALTLNLRVDSHSPV